MDAQKFIKTAEFFGLECTDRRGEEWICTCVECEKPGHMYWNMEKNVGYCHHCGASFLPMDILAPLVECTRESLSPDRLKALARDRGLPVEAFEGHGLGYWGDRYILPVLGIDGKLSSIRNYRLGAKIQTCGGCEARLWGAERLGDESRKHEPVYLLEGEWDGIALEWLRLKAGAPGVVAAVPGADIFKLPWHAWFRDREVFVAYDNDEAGRRGMAKVAKSLTRMRAKVSTISWPAGQEKGFDVRDLITTNL